MKRHFVYIISLLIAVTAGAVPAKPGLRTVTQADGTEIKVQKVGDENFHMYLTPDGHPLMRKDGIFYYAEIDNSGKAINSGMRASEMAERTAAENEFLAKAPSGAEIAEALKAARPAPRFMNRSQRAQAPAQSGVGLFPGATFPRKGKIKGLVILVEYADVKMTLGNKAYQYFNDLLNKEGFSEYNATGSARDYFLESSMGQFDPQFDVFGPVTLPQKQAYYGGNDANGNDLNPEMMVVDAAGLLDSQINFKDYDLDNDGYVDNIFIFYAGKGEASYGSDDTVWPHQWDIESAGRTCIKDGVRISRYACTNEWGWSTPDGIGTFVHEFSHVMGLPDLYTTNYGSARTLTPGSWSVLDSGPYNNDGRTPPAYGAFERNAMGWIEPTVVDKAASITLNDIRTSNEAVLIPTSKNTEFFLLENRQQKGGDIYLPGHGMLVWHVDYDSYKWMSNAVNNTASHQYVDIEEAGGNANNESATTMASYTFPGTKRVTSFTDDTRPSMKTWAGASLGLPITSIAESNGVITFDVAGGIPKIATPTVTAPGEITEEFLTANWNPVDGATHYLLTVMEMTENGETEYTADFTNKALPEGWTASKFDTYTSLGYYGKASPSFKFAADGVSLTTATYPSSVSSVSFWYRGASSAAANLFVIQGLVDGNWVEIGKVSPSSAATAGVTHTISEIPDGVKQVRFVYNKAGAGNIALDDVTITAGGSSYTPLEGYDSLNVGNTTSHRVDISGIKSTMLAYKVCASDGNYTTPFSDIQIVDLSPNSGIDGIEADSTDTPCEYFNLNGIRVDSTGLIPGIYIRRQGAKVQKIIIR
jgi:M6 family metalloprotease-like protein